MSSQAKGRMAATVFSLALIIIGAILIAAPTSAWESMGAVQLASLGTDPTYTVTLTMQLTDQSGTVINANKICGPSSLSDTNYLSGNNNQCFNKGYVGSVKDPWSVYDAGSFAASTTLLRAKGSLTRSLQSNQPVSGVYVDISWYYAIPQQSGGFQVFQITRVMTSSDGQFITQPFPLPSQATGQQIIFFAEVDKGPYSGWTCTQSTQPSTAYCFAQSEHYLVSLGRLLPTQPALSIWVGEGCTYGAGPPSVSSTCTLVWRDGQDITGATEIKVNLPFQMIIIATQGPDPTSDLQGDIWVHVKPYPVGEPSTVKEQPGFPAKMGTNQQWGRVDGKAVHVYVLYVGEGKVVQLPPGRYNVEWTMTSTPPWVLTTTVLAILNIDSAGSIMSSNMLTIPRIAGGFCVIFGLIGMAMSVPRKP